MDIFAILQKKNVLLYRVSRLCVPVQKREVHCARSGKFLYIKSYVEYVTSLTCQ
jgi:hypothetical protein